jgi:hypothetical protein
VITNHDRSAGFQSRLFINVFKAHTATPKAAPTTSSKDTEMNTISTIISANKATATTAGFMEAGRIANNEVTKLLSKKLPIMVRGYANTPMGKLVVANIAMLAVQHFRQGDAALTSLSEAMAVQAYQELIQTLDIEEFIDGLLDSKQIKSALKKLPSKDSAE